MRRDGPVDVLDGVSERLTLCGVGDDGHGEVGPMTVLGSGEPGIEEGDRLRTNSTGGRGAGPDHGLEFGARSLPKPYEILNVRKKSFRTVA